MLYPYSNLFFHIYSIFINSSKTWKKSIFTVGYLNKRQFYFKVRKSHKNIQSYTDWRIMIEWSSKNLKRVLSGPCFHSGRHASDGEMIRPILKKLILIYLLVGLKLESIEKTLHEHLRRCQTLTQLLQQDLVSDSR